MRMEVRAKILIFAKIFNTFARAGEAPYPTPTRQLITKQPSLNMQSISATILTHNEESQIGRCLRSLQGVADEIVVVDSYSTDRTLELCQQAGCKVSQRKFMGFGPARQYATSLTTHPYILTIDADEELSEELRQSIIALKEQGLTHRVYAMLRRNLWGEQHVRHGGWENDVRIRLFNKRYANWDLRSVEETVVFPDTLRPCLLEGELIHYRCDSAHGLRRKEMRHAMLKAKVLETQRDSIGALEPLINGIEAFIASYALRGGYREGLRGWHIARCAFLCSHAAYSRARRKLRERTDGAKG